MAILFLEMVCKKNPTVENFVEKKLVEKVMNSGKQEVNESKKGSLNNEKMPESFFQKTHYRRTDP